MLAAIAPYLIVLVLLIGASAFFSGTEVALFSLRRVDRQQMADSDNKADRLVTKLVARPRRAIAVLLIGNETVNVSVSAVIASMAPTLFPNYGEVTLALAATLLALPLLLFFGEITPKTIAMKTAVGWSRAAARPLWLFGILVTPLRIVVSAVAGLLARPFGGGGPSATKRDLSEAEFKALVDAGSAEGEVDARERRLIHRVFEFGDKTVEQVMLERRSIYALSYDLPMPRLIREVAAGGYSRVPIYERSRDRIRGILYAKDLVVEGTRSAGPRRLTELLHEPLFVPRNIPLERLFRIFKQRKTHMALVVNEYGKLIGLVTMEDLLEELFGEISDEREHQKASVVHRVRLSTAPVSLISPEDLLLDDEDDEPASYGSKEDVS